ncbi:MAG TPA: glycosyltransferase [Bacteroidia bacterium]|nr:glycosyltransferase [Bacteroidia bacterium]
MKPIISIIIPCYNQGDYLEDALKSVEQYQDKGIYEIIIVNDGSTDSATLTVLKELSAKGYNIINQPNKGLGAARNVGIKIAKGKYILPLDSDNKIRPEYILEGIKILEENPELDVVYGNAEYFGEKAGLWESGEFNLQRLMIENYIDACAVYRKSLWEKLGGYDERMPVMGYEDWDFWLRIAFQGGKFQYINKVMFDYRYSAKSMIRSVQKDKLAAIFEYMDKKHGLYLNRLHLNRLILFKASKEKNLAFNLFMRACFPRFSNLLRKAGLMKNKGII